MFLDVFYIERQIISIKINFFTIIILATYLIYFCNLVHKMTYTFVVCPHEIEVK
jgi:hypothetical protein